MNRDWTEEDIAAFVDGALDDEEAARIAASIDRDADARALAEEVGQGNALLRAAFADVAKAPAPPALAATLAYPTETVMPFRKRRVQRRAWIPAAIAASVAIVVGVGIGSQFGETDGATGPEITLGDAPRDSDLHLALETLPSGTAHDDRILPMLTFRDVSGRYCREFEVVGDLAEELEFGIACRTEDAAWHVEIIVTAPTINPDDGGFAPASGPGADALASMIEALGGGAPLAPDAEASLLRNNWQP